MAAIKQKAILWINPVGSDSFDEPIRSYLEIAKRPDTVIHIVSFPFGPRHVEYHSMEGVRKTVLRHHLEAWGHNA